LLTYLLRQDRDDPQKPVRIFILSKNNQLLYPTEILSCSEKLRRKATFQGWGIGRGAAEEI
jgi:hypothetical protein